MIHVTGYEICVSRVTCHVCVVCAYVVHVPRTENTYMFFVGLHVHLYDVPRVRTINRTPVLVQVAHKSSI